jgi:hypothetical protein
MPRLVTGPRRGRPPRNPVDTVRTQFWFNLVSQMAGKTAYQLEKEFHPESFRRDEAWLVRSRRWDRYREGKMVPKDDLIARVEQVYPSAAAWFRAAFWDAFKVGALSQDEVNRHLLTLEPGIPDILFKPVDSQPRRERQPMTEALADQLVADGSLQAMAAAILLVKESEAIASEPLRTLAINVYFRLTYEISRNYPPLREIYPHLFDYLDSQCKSWTFPSANRRLLVLIFWQGYRDRCWPPAAAEASRELVARLDSKKAQDPVQAAFEQFHANRNTEPDQPTEG